MFALTVAVGTGLAALSSIDFTGVDYRQHPIATIVGTLLPSVMGGVIAYFIAPRIFPNFRLHVPAGLLDNDMGGSGANSGDCGSCGCCFPSIRDLILMLLGK